MKTLFFALYAGLDSPIPMAGHEITHKVGKAMKTTRAKVPEVPEIKDSSEGEEGIYYSPYDVPDIQKKHDSHVYDGLHLDHAQKNKPTGNKAVCLR